MRSGSFKNPPTYIKGKQQSLLLQECGGVSPLPPLQKGKFTKNILTFLIIRVAVSDGSPSRIGESMEIQNWIILLGIATLVALPIVGYGSHTVGGFFSQQFEETPLEQVGDVITDFGDMAYSAFWMFLAMALIVTLGILYVRTRIAS